MLQACWTLNIHHLGRIVITIKWYCLVSRNSAYALYFVSLANSRINRLIRVSVRLTGYKHNYATIIPNRNWTDGSFEPWTASSCRMSHSWWPNFICLLEKWQISVAFVPFYYFLKFSLWALFQMYAATRPHYIATINASHYYKLWTKWYKNALPWKSLAFKLHSI